MATAEYDRFRDSPNCGWVTGTVWTGPRICDKPAKYTIDDQALYMVPPTVNGKVCGVHVRGARARGLVAEPIGKEN